MKKSLWPSLSPSVTSVGVIYCALSSSLSAPTELSDLFHTSNSQLRRLTHTFKQHMSDSYWNRCQPCCSIILSRYFISFIFLAQLAHAPFRKYPFDSSTKQHKNIYFSPWSVNFGKKTKTLRWQHSVIKRLVPRTGSVIACSSSIQGNRAWIWRKQDVATNIRHRLVKLV